MADQMSDYLISQMNANPINLNTSAPDQPPPATSSAGSSAAPATVDASGNPVDPNASTQVAGITVNGRRPPKASIDYNNTDAANKVMSAMRAEPAPPGGGDNPGLFGLIPGMSHGTLRNVLGAVGDAFLMHAGQQPWYEQRLQAQKFGIAHAGYGDNPEAAIEREAFVNPAMADKDEQSYQALQARKASLAQTAQWHEDSIEQRRQYESAQTEARNQSNLQRMIPYVGGLAQGATDAPSYQRVHDQAEAIAQRIGPNYHAADFGLPDVADWKPGMTGNAGMTGSQIVGNTTKIRGQNITHQDALINAGARTNAANIFANSHPPTANQTLVRIAQDVNDGKTLPPGDQKIWDKYTTLPGHTSRALLVGGGNAPGGGRAPPAQQFQNGKVYRDANGNTATYMNGKWIPH